MLHARRLQLDLVPRQAVPAGAAVLISGWIGLTIALESEAALLPLGALAAVLILVNPVVRIGLVIFGALVALQSSQEFDIVKLAYLAGVLVAFVGAAARLRHLPERPRRLLIGASLVTFAVVGIASVVGIAQGTDPLSVFRDAAAYLLIGCTPIFAADAAMIPRRILVRFLVVAGTITTLAYGLAWATAHDIVGVGVGRLFYPSLMLTTALFAYAIGKAFSPERPKLWWFLLACMILAVALLTGTRTAIILLVIPAVLVVSRRLRSGRGRRILVLIVAAALVYAGATLLTNLTSADTGLLIERYQRVFTDPSTDLSLVQRASETSSAWQSFLSNPVLGIGLGQGFFIEGVPYLESADTALSFLGKFGLVGLFGLGFVTVLLKRAVRGFAPSQLAAVIGAYLACTVAALPLLNVVQEKGFSLALLLLLGLALSNRADTEGW